MMKSGSMGHGRTRIPKINNRRQAAGMHGPQQIRQQKLGSIYQSPTDGPLHNSHIPRRLAYITPRFSATKTYVESQAAFKSHTHNGHSFRWFMHGCGLLFYSSMSWG